MTTETDSAPLSRAERASLLAGAGIAAMLLARFTDSTPVVVAAIALLGVAAVMGMSAGWFVGLTPRASAAAAPTSLVGMRIGLGDSCFTVLDDSAPSVTAALQGGGRCSVMAVDERGGATVLFLGLDRRGRVVEAATAERDWDVAVAVG